MKVEVDFRGIGVRHYFRWHSSDSKNNSSIRGKDESLTSLAMKKKQSSPQSYSHLQNRLLLRVQLLD